MIPPPHRHLLLPTKHVALYFLLWTIFFASAITSSDKIAVENDYADEEEEHPDPNDEHYPGMVYIGRMDDDGKRVGFDADNGKYVIIWLLKIYFGLSSHVIVCIELQ